MARRTLEVVLVGESSRLERAFKRVDGAFGKLIKRAAIASAAIAAVGGAFAGKALVNAARFQKQLAEVRTLLPELTDKGFARLRDEVLAFSDELGIATDKAIPALYQAISAGVPRDNVIEFMQTAARASIGGITELEVAVDGITSVINAYGTDVLSAQRASDLMFTAVRLGKTTFDELAQSLFNVVPIAAASGVRFEEITAGRARLTAPTA